MNTLTWTNEHGQTLTTEWRTENQQSAPKQALITPPAGLAADSILKHAHKHTAIIWRSDFHQAKQVLAAMKKRLRKPGKPAVNTNPAQQFHRHRMQQAQQSRLLNMLAVCVQPGFQLDIPRAPDIYSALLDIYPTPNQQPFLLPLNQLLGFIGAHEWHKRGVDIPALHNRIHVPFGVFSPLRGEYLDLLMQAPLPNPCHTAFDIGTGSGILAILLAKRGIPHIIGTDTNPRAIACARTNIQRLGFEAQASINETDLFPQGRADLIVCNPPWLPAKPTSAIEAALYDPESSMLKAFLHHAADHLNPSGEIWLIMSDLAEHLGLRATNELEQLFQSNNLKLIDRLTTSPTHAKAHDPNNPLAFARNQETTSLYRLRPA